MRQAPFSTLLPGLVMLRRRILRRAARGAHRSP